LQAGHSDSHEYQLSFQIHRAGQTSLTQNGSTSHGGKTGARNKEWGSVHRTPHQYQDSSHLAEQMALKSFVPVVALAADKTLTSMNIPWIFRLQPDTTPATALRMLVAAECRSGANSERLRNVLALDEGISGIAFLPTGEPRKQ
jgi:hypothetical protein